MLHDLPLKPNEGVLPFSIEQRHIHVEYTEKAVCDILFPCRSSSNSPAHALGNASAPDVSQRVGSKKCPLVEVANETSLASSSRVPQGFQLLSRKTSFG